jgi:hypothetical protein
MILEIVDVGFEGSEKTGPAYVCCVFTWIKSF